MSKLVEIKQTLKKVPSFGPALAILRYLWAKKYRREGLRRTLPRSVAIELTNSCNLRCAKCPTYDAKRPKGFISKRLLTKVLNDIERANDSIIVAYGGGGEPLLHPELIDFVRMAKQVQNVSAVTFATNALTLTPELSQSLLEAGLSSLKVSLDTTDPKTYFKINRVDGYEKVVENIRNFSKIKKEGGYHCPVTLKVTLYKNNPVLVQEIRTLWEHYVDSIRMTNLHNWLGLRGNRKEAPRVDPCEHLWGMIQILWNGQMTLCCNDSMEGFFNMGNAADKDISQYWRADPRLNELRAQHLARDFSKIPICAGCTQDSYETIYYTLN